MDFRSFVECLLQKAEYSTQDWIIFKFSKAEKDLRNSRFDYENLKSYKDTNEDVSIVLKRSKASFQMLSVSADS